MGFDVLTLKNILGKQTSSDLEDSTCLLEYLLKKELVNIPTHEIEGNLNHASTFAALYNCWQTFWFIVELFLRRTQGLFDF